MPVTVEDGSIVNGANSYASLDEYKTYMLHRGIEADFGDDELEAKLVISASYLNSRYGHRFEGRKVSRDQPMPWPREGVDDLDGYRYDYNDIPSAIITAQLELAVRALTRKLSDDVLPEANIKRRRERVEGVFEEEVEYNTGSSGSNTSASAIPVFPEIDNILSPFLKSGGTGSIEYELVRG